MAVENSEKGDFLGLGGVGLLKIEDYGHSIFIVPSSNPVVSISCIGLNSTPRFLGSFTGCDRRQSHGAFEEGAHGIFMGSSQWVIS